MALSRAGIPAGERHIVEIYIDELQDYLSLPTDLSDALAQARGLGVGMTLAHQYRDQLPPDIRSGIDANTRNKIVFGLQGGDAKATAAMAPELTAEDLMALPRYQIYASFRSGGRNTGWIGGVRAGSSSLIWHLTHAGERLLRLRDAKAFPVRRRFEPSAYFLAHTLAVAETAIKLIEICREHEPEIAALQLEPECWRAYSNAGVSLSLKPDLYAVTTTEEYEDRYFIEVDLDTESPTKIIEKCQRYHAYYRSGLEQERSEMFPLTVWIVPNITRKEKLIRQLKKAFDKQTKLFAVITCDELEKLVLEGGDRETLC